MGKKTGIDICTKEEHTLERTKRRTKIIRSAPGWEDVLVSSDFYSPEFSSGEAVPAVSQG